jgi:hypothetical protein
LGEEDTPLLGRLQPPARSIYRQVTDRSMEPCTCYDVTGWNELQRMRARQYILLFRNYVRY